jgi:hypothetical protein
VIPPLALPPPALPFRHYGHTYLKNKTLLSIKMGTSTSVGLRRMSTHTPELLSGDHDRRTQCVHLGSDARDFVRFPCVAGNVPVIAAAQNLMLLMQRGFYMRGRCRGVHGECVGDKRNCCAAAIGTQPRATCPLRLYRPSTNSYLCDWLYP